MQDYRVKYTDIIFMLKQNVKIIIMGNSPPTNLVCSLVIIESYSIHLVSRFINYM